MVTTTAPGMLSLGTKAGPQASDRPFLCGLLALTWLLLILTLGTRRTLLLGRAAFSLGFSVVFVLFVASCGGGNASGGASSPGTAAGSYTLIVNGSVSLGLSNLTRNLSLTLQVH